MYIRYINWEKLPLDINIFRIYQERVINPRDNRTLSLLYNQSLGDSAKVFSFRLSLFLLLIDVFLYIYASGPVSNVRPLFLVSMLAFSFTLIPEWAETQPYFSCLPLLTLLANLFCPNIIGAVWLLVWIAYRTFLGFFLGLFSNILRFFRLKDDYTFGYCSANVPKILGFWRWSQIKKN